MSDGRHREIDVLLSEERRFEPPAGFREQAHVGDRAPYDEYVAEFVADGSSS